MEIKTITTDVLIIGSGGAGCRAAIEVSNQGKEPLIVSKGLSFRSGCTGMAEGGYNAALALVDPEDSVEAHVKDTLKGGSYLNDPNLVDILVNESPEFFHGLFYGTGCKCTNKFIHTTSYIRGNVLRFHVPLP